MLTMSTLFQCFYFEDDLDLILSTLRLIWQHFRFLVLFPFEPKSAHQRATSRLYGSKNRFHNVTYRLFEKFCILLFYRMKTFRSCKTRFSHWINFIELAPVNGESTDGLCHVISAGRFDHFELNLGWGSARTESASMWPTGERAGEDRRQWTSLPLFHHQYRKIDSH